MSFTPTPLPPEPVPAAPAPEVDEQATPEVRRPQTRWAVRRVTRARWGPVTPAQRLIWRDKGL